MTGRPEVTSYRAANVEIAQALRAQGLTLREIGEVMGGAAPSTVSAWLCDPDGSQIRARKQSYAGTCADCGAPTNGSRGRDKASVRCARCATRFQTENARWTREAILDAIRDWNTRHGYPPAANQWGTTARRVAAGADSRYPFTTQVLYRFGRWNAAIIAAGLRPRKTSRP